jgi:large subunit ribosomal protein L4
MQLELLNEQGQAASKYDAPETVFGREYNEDLVHQIVVAFRANARQGTRAQKDREQVKHSTKKPFKQKGTGRARAGMTSVAAVARRWPDLPEHARKKTSPTRSTRRCTARAWRPSSRSWPGKAAWPWSIPMKVDSPKTKQLAAKLQGHEPRNRCMVIAEEVDENLYLASRNLVNVLVVEPRYADPLSLVHYKKVLVTKGAIDKLKEMFA